MAISSKILSQVPAEDEFSSASSRHILVEDGGIIKRLDKAGLKELPVVTFEDAGKVVIVDDEGNYALANAGSGGGGSGPVAVNVDTTQDAWSGANWDELIAAAKNGRAVSLGVDGADAQTVLLHYDEQADSAETKIIETEPKIYYYSTLAGAVSDSNAGTVGTNADASQGTAVVSLYVDDNGLPNIVLLQNTSITSGLSFERNAVLDLNGHKITAELGNPESHAYAVLVNRGYSLRIKGQTLGSAIESNTGSGPVVTLLYNNVGSYLEVLGGEYTVNAAETTIGVCVRNYGNVLLKDMTINATAQKVGGITSGSGSLSLRQNNNIQNVTVNVVGLSDSTRAIDIQNAESTLISNCHLYANSDTESGRIYGIYLDNTSKPTIIQNSEIVADSNYHFADGSYTVLSTGINTGTMCSYLLLQNCTVKGCHTSAELHCSTDIDGGYYSSAGHGVYFSGTDATHRVKGAEIDDLYVGTHSSTNQNHVGAYIGGYSSSTGISVYADNTNISSSNYSWVLRGSSDEHDNALFISNSDINNKKIRIDNETLKLYLGEGNTFDADDTTRPANVAETGADYTFTPTATEISYSGQPVTGSLTERDPGSVAIREVSLSANGNVTVTDYELVQKSELSGGGGGSNIFRVIISGEGKNITADKSYEEILVAYTNGSLVFAVQNDEHILYLTNKSKTGNLKFTSYDTSTGSGGFYNLSIDAIGKWTEQ